MNSAHPQKMIIGLIGQPSSGKDTAAHYLESRGWKHISTSDIIRDDMRRTGVPLDRENMHNFAIEMREKNGSSYPASLAVERATETVDEKRSDLGKGSAVAGVVISGMRNKNEIAVMREAFGKQFLLMVVDAPIELRYARASKRGRVGDDASFEAFKALEDKERKGSATTQDLDAIIAMADCVVSNDGDEAKFFGKIDRAIMRG